MVGKKKGVNGYANPAANDEFFFDRLQRGLLLVNADGSVWHFHSRRRRFYTLKLIVNHEDRLFVRCRVHFIDSGKVIEKAISLPRLLWMSYHRKRIPAGHDIHHVDENRDNNDPRNLEPELPKNHRRNWTSFGGVATKEADNDAF
jgi:hypothetical protein